MDQVLADGTYLSHLNGARGKRTTVRVIEYTVMTTTLDADGVSEETSELFRLNTTLLDPASAPARELAELYTARWTSETVFKHIKIEQRGGRTATLRSMSPAMVEQELWAMRCVYQAVHLAAESADRAHLPVSHISFKQTLAAARRSVGADFPPRQLAAKVRDVQADLVREAVKPRPGRAAPRATKRSGTGYRTLRPDEPATSHVAPTPPISSSSPKTNAPHHRTAQPSFRSRHPARRHPCRHRWHQLPDQATLGPGPRHDRLSGNNECCHATQSWVAAQMRSTALEMANPVSPSARQGRARTPTS
ncbi:transposase [Streptomyces marianii]|uniref:Transposase n=1 Tax=Streptomyces marianii TaxID=1817406 RepID=A0A5R9E8P2_9ACTN|nr:transposase [Streptomyces marianii]TLQ44594.1 transposase [Streptomyces marianii]